VTADGILTESGPQEGPRKPQARRALQATLKGCPPGKETDEN